MIDVKKVTLVTAAIMMLMIVGCSDEKAQGEQEKMVATSAVQSLAAKDQATLYVWMNGQPFRVQRGIGTFDYALVHHNPAGMPDHIEPRAPHVMYVCKDIRYVWATVGASTMLLASKPDPFYESIFSYSGKDGK